MIRTITHLVYPERSKGLQCRPTSLRSSGHSCFPNRASLLGKQECGLRGLGAPRQAQSKPPRVKPRKGFGGIFQIQFEIYGSGSIINKYGGGLLDGLRTCFQGITEPTIDPSFGNEEKPVWDWLSNQLPLIEKGYNPERSPSIASSSASSPERSVSLRSASMASSSSEERTLCKSFARASSPKGIVSPSS